MDITKKFKICHGKGFHITLKNGWTISVQFGAGNYCENYNLILSEYKENQGCMTSDNAEIWCWNESESRHYPEEPLSHQTPEDLLKLMIMISKKRK